MKVRYNKYSDFLVKRYGEKVYKLPIKLSGTCPNRDEDNIGCHFCGEEGGSFENLDPAMDVKNQLKTNREYISKKYNSNKFIAYFQNYTNTYMSFSIFKESIYSSISDDIVAIYISTRPDCITNDQLAFLKRIKLEYDLDIVMEIGLQTSNYKVLNRINRGHGLAEFIDAVNRCKKYGIDICTHVLIGLPGDEILDTIETSKIVSALKVDQIKLHALYILKDTEFGKQYLEHNLEVISKEEYIERVIIFLRYLSPEVVVQRLIGRSPLEDSLFSNWSTSWWKIQEETINIMELNNFYQGDLFDYLVPKEV